MWSMLLFRPMWKSTAPPCFVYYCTVLGVSNVAWSISMSYAEVDFYHVSHSLSHILWQNSTSPLSHSAYDIDMYQATDIVSDESGSRPESSQYIEYFKKVDFIRIL